MWEASQHLPNIYHKNLIVLQSDVLGRPRAHVRRPRDVQEDVQGTSKGRPRNVQGTSKGHLTTPKTPTPTTATATAKVPRGLAKAASPALLPDSCYQVEWLVLQSQRAFLELAKVPLLYKGALAMHMCATRPISSHCQDTQTSCRTLSQGFKISRIQNLQDSKLKDSSTQGFKDSRTQGLKNSWMEGLNDSGSRNLTRLFQFSLWIPKDKAHKDNCSKGLEFKHRTGEV